VYAAAAVIPPTAEVQATAVRTTKAGMSSSVGMPVKMGRQHQYQQQFD
jgi:hypothetical protein